MSILELIISSIAPHDCIGCRSEGALLCSACALGLPAVPSRCYRCGKITEDFRTCNGCRRASDLFQVYAATAYDDLARMVVRRLKFERASAAANDMAWLMTKRFVPGQDVLVTYLPTAPARVRQRGYDQAQRMARRLARLWGCPYLPLLGREGTQRQLGQDRNVRLRQMQGAFGVLRPDHLKNRHILLIDDVLTTGASCEAAARALKAAGAGRVSAAVFAVA